MHGERPSLEASRSKHGTGGGAPLGNKKPTKHGRYMAEANAARQARWHSAARLAGVYALANPR
jgi:hypothetical protein